MRQTKITVNSIKEPYQTIIFGIEFTDLKDFLKKVDNKLNLLSFKNFNCKINNKDDFNSTELEILSKEGFYD